MGEKEGGTGARGWRDEYHLLGGPWRPQGHRQGSGGACVCGGGGWEAGRVVWQLVL